MTFRGGLAVITSSDRQPVSPFAGDSEMAQRMRTFDWSGTPLGPVEGWPQSLRTAVGIMLESRHPMLIWWGPEFTMFYNDALVPLAGAKHPVGLGSPGSEMFAKIWPTIGPMLVGCCPPASRRGSMTAVGDEPAWSGRGDVLDLFLQPDPGQAGPGPRGVHGD